MRDENGVGWAAAGGLLLRRAKGSGYAEGHRLVVEALQRWAALARRSEEQYYTLVYERLAFAQIFEHVPLSAAAPEKTSA
jgi:hypothetical protein